MRFLSLLLDIFYQLHITYINTIYWNQLDIFISKQIRMDILKLLYLNTCQVILTLPILQL